MSKSNNLSYKDVEPLLIAVDCIIFGFDDEDLKVLLFQREIEPLAGQWSLIGSFVKVHESATTAAHRILTELSGLENIYMEQLYCFSDVDRDAGGRVVSVAYWSLIKIEDDNPDFKIDGHTSKWVSLSNIPPLVLDHNAMIEKAIDTLRSKAKYQPVGFELLPDQFTLPQLLKVYEAIFQRKIDDRNFRKKILKSGLLIKTENKDKSSSRKGSYLYRFDRKTYKKLKESGYDFQI